MQFNLNFARRVRRKCLNILQRFLFLSKVSHARTVSVFLFHEVSDTPSKFSVDNKLNVDIVTFKQQVLWIQENFNIIHPSQLLVSEKLPRRAAIVSFDDGMLSIFENALPFLKEKGIPSIMFLNMGHIENKTPLISSCLIFLSEKNREMKEFIKNRKITKPAFLSITPQQFKDFKSLKSDLQHDQINRYQGPLATRDIIEDWQDETVVVYGNHLYEHWNSVALTDEEFALSIQKNKEHLSSLQNDINMFAFPNGQPNLCFTKEQVETLKDLGLYKVFYSSGGINVGRKNFLMNRIPLIAEDNTSIKMLDKFMNLSVTKAFQN